MKYFGVDSVTILEGFDTTSRGARLPVCRQCGALVAYETQRAHLDWHLPSAS